MTPRPRASTVPTAHQSDRTETQRHAQHEDVLVDFHTLKFLPQRRIRIAKAGIEGFLVDNLSLMLDAENGAKFIRHCDSANSRKTKELRSVLLETLIEQLSRRRSACLIS
jgi:hypothetical protein